MKLVQTLFFFLLLSLFEALFVPLPLVFAALFLWLVFFSSWQALLLAALSGFWLDLLLVRPLGTTSMLFLLLLFLAHLYQRKFRSNNIFFLSVISFLAFLTIEFFYKGTFSLLTALISSLVVIFLTIILFKSDASYERNIRQTF